MPSKNERIAELERRVAELEQKLADNYLLPKSSPNWVPFPNIPETAPTLGWFRCPNCGGTYASGQHQACWYVNPNRPFTISSQGITYGGNNTGHSSS